MAKYKIKWNYSTNYYPQANGAIEAFNKTLGKILKKIVTRHRRVTVSASLYGRNALPSVPQLKLLHILLSMVVKQFYHWRSS